MGPPNIGKSSLFNALVGREAALVADAAGTTRDWIAARLDTAPTEPACLLVDVAGVRDGPDEGGATDTGHGAIELAAAARARAEIARADVVVACVDAEAAGAAVQASAPAFLPVAAPRIDGCTRCDRVAAPAGPQAAGVVATSAHASLGIADLRAAILAAVANLPAGRSPATLRMQAGLAAAREAVAAARAAATAARAGVAHDEAIVAGLLHQAIAAIGEVTGAELGNDLIDRIFSRHCIGK
ncbi:MAG: GTPase [Planctomycetia bacterium]